MRSGPLTDVKASLIVHGRGLGDDRPLLLTNLDARPMYEATERTMDFQFPENGVYIVKPTIATADKKYQFIWGDTVHLTSQGARRLGSVRSGSSCRSNRVRLAARRDDLRDGEFVRVLVRRGAVELVVAEDAFLRSTFRK